MDKFVAGGIIVTMDKGRRVLEDGAIAIRGDRILDVGETQSLKHQYRPQPSQILNGRGKVIFPGLINLHTHAGLSILRGVGDETVTFPSYTRSIPQGVMLSPEDMYVFSLLGGLEALRFGTTTIVDNYIYSLQNVRAFNDLGLRAVVSERIHDADLFKIPSGVYQFSPEIGEKRLEENLKLIEAWNRKEGGRISCRLGPHAPDTCSEPYLRKVRDLADKLKVGIVTHVAQGFYEGEVIGRRTGGLSPVRFLKEIGLLGDDLIAAHCIFVDDEDVDILARSGTHVTHQPEGNAKYGFMAPMVKMKKAGINVGIGTDNMAADMIEVMRFAVCIGRVKEQSAGALRAMEALEMATLNGARALGMEDEIGSIEAEKKADLVLIDCRKPHWIPLVDPVANLVHNGLGSDVDTVIVNGQTLVEQGRVLVVDEPEILRQAQQLATLRWREIAGREIGFDLSAS